MWQELITKCVRYYKVRQVLQSVPDITKCDRVLLQSASGITKCDSYYKVRHNRCHYNWNRIFSSVLLYSNIGFLPVLRYPKLQYSLLNWFLIFQRTHYSYYLSTEFQTTQTNNANSTQLLFHLIFKTMVGKDSGLDSKKTTIKFELVKTALL